VSDFWKAEAEAGRGFLAYQAGANRVVADNVLRLRKEQGISQTRLRELLAEHGWRPSSLDIIRKTETGLRRISVQELVALAGALGVEPTQLLAPPTGSASGRTDDR